MKIFGGSSHGHTTTHINRTKSNTTSSDDEVIKTSEQTDVNYGKVRDLTSKTHLYSFDYLSKANRLMPLIRDQNEFYYLDKLYNTTTSSNSFMSASSLSSSSSTKSKLVINEPSSIRATQPTTLSSYVSPYFTPRPVAGTSNYNQQSRQVKFSTANDYGLSVLDKYSRCGYGSASAYGRTVGSSSDLFADNYIYSKPFSNYLEIGKTCEDTSDVENKDRAALLLFNKKANVFYTINKTSTSENHKLDINFDNRGFPLY